MTTPDVNTIIATSSSAINWVTDVIVPLTSALIGGLLALWGVHITLNHDTSDRARTQDELARPFFTILDAYLIFQRFPLMVNVKTVFTC